MAWKKYEHRGLSISSSCVFGYIVSTRGYKWVLANTSMTHGKIKGRNNYFLLERRAPYAMFKIKALLWISIWSALEFQPFSWKARSNPTRQSKNIEINTKLMLNLCMNYMIHISSTMWNFENQPCNSTSCSDNALCLLVLVAGILYRGLQVATSSFSMWGCVMKGCHLKSSSLEVLNIICPPQEPTSIGHCHYKKWS
jgi:hypothetical protein